MRGILMAAAAAMSLAAAPASAAVLVVQQSGTFTGMDVNNILGHGFGEVSGIDYTVSFTFDLDNADIQIEDPFMGLLLTSVASGGSNYGRPALATVDIQIGTYGRVLVGAKQSNASQGDPGLIQQSFFDLDDASVTVGASKSFWGVPVDVTAPLAGNLCEVANCYANFDLQNGVYGLASSVSSYTVTYDPEGTYTPPGSPGAVPEPASWALMIAGFGLAGASLRRRRLLA